MPFTHRFRDIFSGFFSLLYPKLCVNCSNVLQEGEGDLCTACMIKLPRTRLHEVAGNEIESRFYGKVDIACASAFLYFEKGNMTQHILHAIKYHGNTRLAEQMGGYFGGELQGGRFTAADMLIPVPLHPKKLKLRGYNQSECICNGIGRVLGIPVITTVLYRTVANATQTKKSRMERWQNVQGIFKAHNTDIVEGKHIIIVDDVLTTGATLEACIHAFDNIKDLKISLLALAAAVN